MKSQKTTHHTDYVSGHRVHQDKRHKASHRGVPQSQPFQEQHKASHTGVPQSQPFQILPTGVPTGYRKQKLSLRDPRYRTIPLKPEATEKPLKFPEVTTQRELPTLVPQKPNRVPTRPPKRSPEPRSVAPS